MVIPFRFPSDAAMADLRSRPVNRKFSEQNLRRRNPSGDLFFTFPEIRCKSVFQQLGAPEQLLREKFVNFRFRMISHAGILPAELC